MNAATRATYAALSWSAVTFVGSILLSWLVGPRGDKPAQYWSFVFKLALTGGVVVGLLALVLGAGFVWEV